MTVRFTQGGSSGWSLHQQWKRSDYHAALGAQGRVSARDRQTRSLSPLPAAEERVPDRFFERGHRGLEVRAGFDRFGRRAAFRGECLRASLLDGQGLVAIPQAAQHGPQLPDLLPGVRDLFEGSFDRYGAALHVLQQVTLEHATAL